MNVSTHGDGSDHYAEFKRQVSTEGGKVSTPRGDSNSHQHNHYHHIFKVLAAPSVNLHVCCFPGVFLITG